MHRSLVSLLADPLTREPLTLQGGPSEGEDIREGTLVAPSGRSFPIIDGIPRFVPSDGYTQSFGDQWNTFREVQLDSETGASHSRERFDGEAGWSAEQLRDKWVLDAGCGAGRFAQIAASRGARLVALDMSSAVVATARTLEGHPHVDVVQGSLLEPPFRPGVFDFAYSLGVIQHTPDPPRGIRQVVSCVRPGGEFAFTIYGRRPWTKLNTKYLIRPLTRRLNGKQLLGAIETAMPVLFPLTDALYRLPVLGQVARFTIPVANYPERVGFTREQRYAESVLDTFDMLAPAYDQPMTAEEVEAELRAVSAASWSFTSRVPVIVRGAR